MFKNEIQHLERVLEESGNDLDSAIKSLKDLRLGSAETSLDSAVVKHEIGIGTETNVQLPTQDLPAIDGFPQNVSEWVEILVREARTASEMDVARDRALRVLEVLEKCITVHASAQAFQSFQKENIMLKAQVGSLFEENRVLKQAVTVFHDRQKDYDEKSQELQYLKQLIPQYQEQIQTLEVKNYALMMHLKQAQQSSSIPGHFHPDVF